MGESCENTEKTVKGLRDNFPRSSWKGMEISDNQIFFNKIEDEKMNIEK